jgi:glutamyl/glutaminyl-tRNA synthetase
MFGWDVPVFAHLPLLVNEDSSKLSKRQGHASVDWYRDRGFLPESLVNFVSLLGWTPVGDAEIFSMEELIKNFSLERVNKGNSMVSLQKLEWTNSRQIRRLIDENIQRVVDLLIPQMKLLTNREIDENYLKLVLNTVKDRIKNLNEFSNHFSYFFVDLDFEKETTKQFKEKIDKIEKRKEIFNLLREKFGKLNDFTADNANNIINEVKDEVNVTYNHTVSVLRYSVTGSSVGSSIAQTCCVLGKDLVTKRLNNENLI